MENKNKIWDLEKRLISFSVLMISISEALPNTKAGSYFAGQMVRSGSSPALNYGEAKDAESNADFIHKVKIVLKELRETFVALQIIEEANLLNDNEKLQIALKECNELISIFVATVKKAKDKKNKINKKIIA